MFSDPDPYELGLRLLGRVQLDLADAVADATLEATSQTSRQLVALGEVIRRGLGAADLQGAHQHIGERAQRSVLGSYDQVVTARETAAGRTHYRIHARNPRNRRFAGGRLRRALASPAFFEATPRGLRFINVDLLNREAKHWARLIFGARPRGQGSRRAFPVTFSNLFVASIGLEQEARPGFSLPRGYFFDLGENKAIGASPSRVGQDPFYPGGTGPLYRRSARLGKRRATRGIEARNFLDAGMARTAREFGPTYTRLYQRMWDKGIIAARSAPGSVVGPRTTGMFTHRVRTYTNY